MIDIKKNEENYSSKYFLQNVMIDIKKTEENYSSKYFLQYVMIDIKKLKKTIVLNAFYNML